MVAIPGSTCRQVPTPVGPLSWGPLVSSELKGTYATTLGPNACQSLMARFRQGKQSVSAKKGDLEKRIPVARRSTLTDVDARGVMQMGRELRAPAQDKLIAFLDASGLSDIVTAGAVSGMTTEGVSGTLWLGFGGTPTGLFAAPASGIGTKQLRRILSDAKVLLSMLLAAKANGDGQLAVHEIPYRNQTLFCLKIAADEFVFPIEPIWCLTDDSFFVTNSPQFMKTQLACDPEDNKCGSLGEVQKAVHAGEPSVVATVDPAWSVGSFCSLHEVVSPFVVCASASPAVASGRPVSPRSRQS